MYGNGATILKKAKTLCFFTILACYLCPMQDYGVIRSENQFFKTLNNVLIDIKREDLLHPEVSGNKLRKLKYNILHAQEESINTLVTYGGAFSNHIAATSAASKIAGLSSIGIITVNLDVSLNIF